MLIDTHSHLNFKAYDNDRDEVIKRTQKEGIVCIDIGTKYETSERAVELAENNKNIFAAIGMHPFHIKTDLLKIKTDKEEGSFTPLGEELNIYRYKELARSKKVIAIGEIGLDYYYSPKTKKKIEEFKKIQKDVFVKQLDLAKDLNLPVIIHCRAAFNDIYEILKNKKLRGVIHCFVGTVEEMKKIVDLGFYIGLNGIIFKLDLGKVIKECPLDKILIETDCPYLTPPKSGTERNEPVFVKYVAERIAELKNISFNQIAEQATKNSKKLFNI